MKLGLISDIHEDIYSLQKALGFFEKNGCDEIVCLGDIVGFTIPFYRYIETRDAEECVRLIKENCKIALAGNHDLYAIRKVPEFKAGFDYGQDWYSLDYNTRSKKARERIWLYEDNEIKANLSDSSKEFLNSLKEFYCFNTGKLNIFFSHFCFPDLSGSAIFFPREPFHLLKHFEFTKEYSCKISISGHGHPEGLLVVNEDMFTNKSFGTYKIKDEMQWIVVPCTARTSRANGVAVFDTEEMTINSFPYNKITNG